MLLHLRFSYTKPTYSLTKVNSEKQEAFKENFKVLNIYPTGKIAFVH